MQIVIDIPEDYYEIIKHDVQGGNDYLPFKLIANGTPLPKGHGRLIDAEKLCDRMYHETFDLDTELQMWDSGCWIRYKLFEQVEKTTPTIIEADKEAEDEN